MPAYHADASAAAEPADDVTLDAFENYVAASDCGIFRVVAAFLADPAPQPPSLLGPLVTTFWTPRLSRAFLWGRLPLA